MCVFLVSCFICMFLFNWVNVVLLLMIFVIVVVSLMFVVIFIGGMFGLYCFIVVLGCMFLMFLIIYGISLGGLKVDVSIVFLGLVMVIVGGVLMLFL